MKFLLKKIIAILLIIFFFTSSSKANIKITCIVTFIMSPKINIDLDKNKILINQRVSLIKFNNLNTKIVKLQYKQFKSITIMKKLNQLENYINPYSEDYTDNFSIFSKTYKLIEQLKFDNNYCSFYGNMNIFLDTILNIKEIYKINKVYIVFAKKYLIIFDSKQNLFFIYKTVE